VAIAVVYALFAIGTTSFVVFAMKQPVDLVSSDYYERSLTYDQRLRATENAAVGAVPLIAPSADGHAIDITMPPSAGPVSTGRVTLYRASDAKSDRSVPLPTQARGALRIDMTGARHGRWIVQIQWRVGERDFYHEQSVQLP